MARKKKISLTSKVKNFIVDKLAEGMNVAAICRTYPNEVPDVKTIYRAQVKDEEFASKMTEAYTCYYMQLIGELDEISKALPSEMYPNVDFKEAEATLKRRQDGLKYSIAKLAPILSSRFDKAQKVEHTGEIKDSGPKYVIMDYAAKLEKPVEDVRDKKEITDE